MDIGSYFKRFRPAVAPVSRAEKVRAALGAFLGILLTGLLTRLTLGPSEALPLLIAPMGASAVLLFAVPASPLAQPWSMAGGNLVASLVGVTAAAWIADPFLAAAVGVAGAVAGMLALRCVHPPSGAVALTAVLGGPAVKAAGYGFVLFPVGINTLILLAVALAYNTLVGRSYPHAAGAPAPRPTGDPAPTTRVGFSPGDLKAVLEDYGQLIDVDPDDLREILQRAEMRAYHRRSGELTCGDIMTRDVVAVAPGTPIAEALDLMRTRHIKVLPVTSETAEVLGIVTQTDLMDKVAWGAKGPRVGLGQRLRHALEVGAAPQGVVEEIMSVPVRSATAETPIATLVPLMADSGLHHLPVVDAHRKLTGLVTQSDLIAALFKGSVSGLPDAGRSVA